MNKILLGVSALVLAVTSCSKDFLDTKPTNQVESDAVFNSVEGGQAVLNGLYRYMYDTYSTHDDFGYKAIDLANDLMGEDIVNGSFHWFVWDYLLDNNQPNYRRPGFIWNFNYKIIYSSNKVIDKISDLPDSDRKYFVLAQAYAARANAYTNLIYQYSKTYVGHENDEGIPLVLEPSQEALAPATVGEVYNQIVLDLEEAIRLFDESGMSQPHVSYIDGYVARGFRARIALIMNDWTNASKFAGEARANYDIMTSDEFSAGFDDYSKQNWMWGFEVNDEQSTVYGSYNSHIDMTIGGYAGGNYNPKFVSSELYDQMDDNDVRKLLIVDEADRVGGSEGYALVNYKFNAGKGKGFSADYTMMRPEEMLLIEAEALAREGKNEEAVNLLFELHSNRIAGAVKSENTGEALVEEILLERRIELWAEGFRLFDLKRTKSGYVRGGNHAFIGGANITTTSEDDRFDRVVPQGEIDANANYR